jgi:hypothetical protein
MLASCSFSETYHDDLIKIVAPLSAFCTLYNLFLLPILDKEFLRGEAIFSKMDLIKMSSILKDICMGVIVLMHPDLPYTSSTTNDQSLASAAATSSRRYVHIRQKQAQNSAGNAFTRSTVSSNRRHSAQMMDLKIKAKYFTHLFQSCALLVQRMYTRDIRCGFCPEDHWTSNSQFVGMNKLSSILQAQDPAILTQIKFGQQSYLFRNGKCFVSKLYYSGGHLTFF